MVWVEIVENDLIAIDFTSMAAENGILKQACFGKILQDISCKNSLYE